MAKPDFANKVRSAAAPSRFERAKTVVSPSAVDPVEKATVEPTESLVNATQTAESAPVPVAQVATSDDAA